MWLYFFLDFADAARFGHVDVVQALLKAGADASIANAEGKTAADLAAANDKAQVVALLADKKRGRS
jgi:ankyrin repeat protein